jgi:hypothetical protein
LVHVVDVYVLKSPIEAEVWQEGEERPHHCIPYLLRAKTGNLENENRKYSSRACNGKSNSILLKADSTVYASDLHL